MHLHPIRSAPRSNVQLRLSRTQALTQSQGFGEAGHPQREVGRNLAHELHASRGPRRQRLDVGEGRPSGRVLDITVCGTESGLGVRLDIGPRTMLGPVLQAYAKPLRQYPDWYASHGQPHIHRDRDDHEELRHVDQMYSPRPAEEDLKLSRYG